MSVIPACDDAPMTHLAFAEYVRRLSAAAFDVGIKCPSFRSPPKHPDVARTVVRRPGGVVVAVRLRDRPAWSVRADMRAGVLAANRLDPDGPEAAAFAERLEHDQ